MPIGNNNIYAKGGHNLMTKEELHQIIDRLPEGKLETAQSLLHSLTENGTVPQSAIHGEEANEYLNRFLADLLGSMTSVIYDLSKEAEKRNDQILANRYNFSMKKAIESWEAYKEKLKSSL
jgi:hypothetical protein